MPIRNATLADVAAIKHLTVDTDMFDAEEAGFIDETVG